MLYYSFVSIIVTAITYFICSFIPFKGLIKAACNGVICVICSNVLLLVIYRNHELLEPTFELVDNVTKHKFSQLLFAVIKFIKGGNHK